MKASNLLSIKHRRNTRAAPELRSLRAMQNPPAQPIFSLLLAIVATIPDHTLRYTTLALTVAFALFCTLHLLAPSTQLRHLATFVEQTNELIGRAIAQCSRNHLSLIKQTGRLLEQVLVNPCPYKLLNMILDRVSKSASEIKCRILNSESEHFSWNRYKLLSSEIAACLTRVRNIRTAVQVIYFEPL